MRNIFVPFHIIKKEKAYIGWIVFTLMFGLLNIWGGLLIYGFDNVVDAFMEGTGYTFAISICAPLVADILLNLIVDKKNGDKIQWLSYKLISVFFDIVFIFITALLWCGVLRGSLITQIIIGLISLILSLYIYCVSQMAKHHDIMDQYDDVEYNYLEKEYIRIKDLDANASNLEKIESESGEIEV